MPHLTMKYRFAAIIAFLVMAGAGCVAFRRIPAIVPVLTPSATEAVVGMVGVVSEMNPLDRTFTIVLPDGSTEQISYNKDLDLSGLKLGLLLTLDGTRDRSSRAVLATNGQAVQRSGIYVTSPSVGATVTSPLVAFGFASTQTGRIEWRLRDHTGTTLREGSADVHVVAADGFGPFRLDVFLPSLGNPAFTLELSVHDFKGKELQTTSVPLKLLSTETVTFNLFFPNSKKGSSRDCSLVYPVTRTIAKTSAIGRAALMALLKGPTESEKQEGAFSSFPIDVGLRSLVVNDRSANADFDSRLGSVAGSCRVAAIRSEIAQTLLQFAGISEITVSVEGQQNSALQP